MRTIETVGLLIRFKRESQGRGFAEFAADVPISPGYLSRIELGLRNPSPALTAKLARALGCSIQDITRPVPELVGGE